MGEMVTISDDSRGQGNLLERTRKLRACQRVKLMIAKKKGGVVLYLTGHLYSKLWGGLHPNK